MSVIDEDRLRAMLEQRLRRNVDLIDHPPAVLFIFWDARHGIRAVDIAPDAFDIGRNVNVLHRHPSPFYRIT